MKTEIICIMDRSGSMAPIMVEAIAAFNTFVAEQKKVPGKAKLTLAVFDDRYDVIFDRVKLSEVPTLTEHEITARGMTALNDAIGKTINSAKQSKKTICLIQTDGNENCSGEYTNEQIKQLIADKTADGWEFQFVGAGIDAFAAGSVYGLTKGQCINVDSSAAGMRNYSSAIAGVTTSYRTN